MTVARTLARYVTQVKLQDLPEEIVDQTKLCILDWAGVAFTGGKYELVKILKESLLASGAKPECSIIGDKAKTSCLDAALINAATCYVVKLDQGSPHSCQIHPQAPLIPAALAVAERDKLGGQEFLLAVLLGFDVEVRVAMGVNPSMTGERGFHTTGTCGTFGAATAAGKLLRLDEDQMVHALGIAGAQAAGLVINFENMCRPLEGGKAASGGVLAAMLAKKGFTGAEAIFEGKGGFCQAMTNRHDLSKMTDGIGQKYLIKDQRFMMYATGGALHGALDAVIELRNTHNIRPSDIESIAALVSPLAMDVCNIQDPKTLFEAQFSLPFCLAIAAIYGEVSVGQLTQENLQDPNIIALARKVKGSVDPEVAARGYFGGGNLLQSAKVTIKTKDGKEHFKRVDIAKGYPQNPFTKEEIVDKFKSLSSLVLPKARVEEIVNVVENLEKLDSMSKLVKLMCTN